MTVRQLEHCPIAATAFWTLVKFMTMATERPSFHLTPHPTAIDDCFLFSLTCGKGMLDPGEFCDDENSTSLDDSTQSCTLNAKRVHATCNRTIIGESDLSSEDITTGVIINGENAALENGFVSGCVFSYRSFGKNECAAEGDSQYIALSCDDSNSNSHTEIESVPFDGPVA